jgi:hypothetical protein
MNLDKPREYPATETPTRTSYNTRFDGQKVRLHIQPELVRRGFLAYLITRAGRLRCELSWHPRFQGEQWFLESTLDAEDAFHCPSEMVATTRTDWLGIFEVGA